MSTRLATAVGAFALAAVAATTTTAAPAATTPTTPVATTPTVVAPWADVRSQALPSANRPTLASLAYAPDGSALATWGTTSASGRKATGTAVAGLSATGELGKVVKLSALLVDRPQPTTGGLDLLLTPKFSSARITKLEVRRVRQGVVEPPQRLTQSTSIADASIATAPTGAAVVAWVELKNIDDPNSDYAEAVSVTVKVAIRKAGASVFGTPRTLQSTAGLADGSIDAAISSRGRIVVAFEDRRIEGSNGVRAWSGSAAKGVGTTSVRLGPTSTTSLVRAVVAPSGKAVVAWGTIWHGEDVHSPWTIRAASLTSGGKPTGPAQLVDGDGDRYWAPMWIDLITDTSGRATLAWSHLAKRGSARYEVRVASTGANDRFGKAQRIPAAAVGGLAVRSDGATALTVSSDAAYESGLTHALVRPVGASTFSAPELLSTPVAALGADINNPTTTAADPVFEPFTGRPAIAWIAKTDTGSQLVIQRRDRP